MTLIESLTFTKNRAGEQAGTTVAVPNVLLIVGPNESGKSTALQYIAGWFRGSFDTFDTRIFISGKFRPPERALVQTFLESATLRSQTEDELILWTGDETGRIIHAPPISLNAFCSPESFEQKSWRTAHLTRFFIWPSLDSSQRMLQDVDATQLLPENHFRNLHELLLGDKKKLRKVNDIIRAASGFNVAVKPADQGKFRFIFHPIVPPEEEPSYILSESLRQYYADGRGASDFGSGIRAFFGLALSIFAFEHKLIVLDEPELHLHPPLVKRLAQELVKETIRRNGQLIVATHSPEFVAGCINSSQNVAMVRLTYSKVTGKSTSTVVSKKDLEPFVLDRVIRNTDAINGIFHEYAVVVEGAFDKIAFSEFNLALQERENSNAIKDPHFIAIGGCMSAINVVSVMRKTGTPTALVLDFDVLRLQWKHDHLSSLGVPAEKLEKATKLLGECRFKIDSFNSQENSQNIKLAPKEYLRQHGMNAFEGNSRSCFHETIELLAEYGLFIIASGDLESFVASTLGFSRVNLSKEEIIVNQALRILEANSFSIQDEPLIAQSNIWCFLGAINQWLKAHVE